ncbi:MAG: CRISPR-associated protein Csx3 [Thermodesulfovibrionales bacterium]|nr:CRISPR-associated protein Csx3 [Thermodesulfovibrionales bacterium]
MKEVVIEIDKLYEGQQAKLAELDEYLKKALIQAGEGNSVILTGQGPIWLYLKVAHALHGKAVKLIYRSPVTGDVLIFDHSPF